MVLSVFDPKYPNSTCAVSQLQGIIVRAQAGLPSVA
jgi:hypothetical protein